MIEHALAWAKRGYRVFPCWAGSKLPMIDGWTSAATTDPEQIRQWWTDPVMGFTRDYNVGVLTTGLLVIDIDVKNGRPGFETAVGLGLDFDTLTVRTASGGLHLYYAADNCRSSVDALGAGIDTRGHNGYVLAPGSRTEAGSYDLIFDRSAAALKPAVAAALARSTARMVEAPGVNLDLPISIEQGREYLLNRAPLAIEGRGGHDTTYRVACMLRDFGLSEDCSADMLLELWNERCQPPWEPEELKKIVGNAALYGQNTAGARGPTLGLDGLNIPAPETKPGMVARVNGLRPASEIPPRPWIIPRLLLRDYVTLLIAEGSAGKSTLILALAAHLALGRDFFGFRVPQARGSVIYNAEDDRDELERRIHAVCQWYAMDPHAVMDKVILIEPTGGSLQLVSGSPPSVNSAAVQELIAAAKSVNAGLVALDPLVELHNCREDDNVDMRYVMGTLKLVARQAGCAVMAAHHTSKAGMGSENRAGNASISRGATAIVNAARIAFTISPATDGDCERYGIREDARSRFARIDDAKMNMALVSGKPIWAQRQGVTLLNGDEVGVLAPADMSAAAMREAQSLAALAADVLRANSAAVMPLSDVASGVQARDPLYGELPIATVKARLEMRLAGGVAVDDGSVRSQRERRGGRDEISIVLE